MSTLFLRSVTTLPRWYPAFPTSAVTLHPISRHWSHTPLWNSKSSKESSTGNEQEPGDNIHFKLSSTRHPLGEEITKKVTTSYWENPVPHPIWSKEELLKIEKTHHDPSKVKDRLALFAVKLMRSGFDFASRYKGPGGEMTRNDWLNRCLFLETIAGVPGK
jgi:hypothetical protein